MRIKTGIGVGGAQIFDTSGIQDAYYKQYLQKQKQDQAYAEDLANNLAKYDTTGLTPDDAKYADKLYSDLKNKYLQVNIKDPKQRALANAELKSGMQKIKDFTYNAKKFVGDNQKVGIELAKNRFMYPDEVIQTYDKNIKGQPYYQVMQSGIGDVNQILTQRNPDNSLIDKSLKTLDAQLKGAAEKNVGGIKTEFTPDKKQQVYQYTTDQKTAKAIAKSLLTDDATKANWYYNFKQANPNIEANDDIVSDYIVKQREAMYQGNPYAFKGGVKAVAKEKTGGAGDGLSKADKKELANIDERKSNVRALVDDKSQEVFDLIKATLPANSLIKWINVKGKPIGIKVDAPKSINDNGDVISFTKQFIDFTKGNPYASVNSILNKYTNKIVKGEQFLKEKKPTTQPKPSTSQGKKVIKGF
jgi:hypothetical protein